MKRSWPNLVSDEATQVISCCRFASFAVRNDDRVWHGWNAPKPRIFLFSFVGCLSLQAGSSFIQFWPCLAGVALAPPTGSSATGSDGLAEACQRLPSSYDDGAADGTAGLAGIKVQASVQGEAASSTSVPARSANNGIGFHNVKIAVGA